MHPNHLPRLQVLVRASLNKARALAPNQAPVPTDQIVHEWADTVAHKLGIHPPRPEVWEMAVRDWASDGRGRFLNVGVLIDQVRAAHARWAEDPVNREAVAADRLQRAREFNMRAFGTPDGRKPMRELGPPVDEAKINAVKARYPMLNRRRGK